MSLQLIQQYLPGYPAHLHAQIAQLHDQGKLGHYLSQRYPPSHNIQSDKALYDFCNDFKQRYLKNAPLLDKVYFDNRLTVEKQTLGLNTAISRVQGGKLKAKKEIRISAFFRSTPVEFLTMIVVHELAHLKERDHDKAFYQLCQHMEPNYMQYEFDCRVHLLWLTLSKTQTLSTPLPIQK
ncbi:MAG TPA: YgjP-like metallopeptidase domain-containing protein [Methylophilus sp.]|uniref:YgjP-like metallopeptidase domain-containing protein n=1 Tax=Methylophilus sp. TaxID=29541 RepID=UPI002CB067C9|nr:YgjP-like metallopeptidase domain-containing protein [Methylophilus sp.]HSH87652.1 YgjP-like metallopeptidase domain-containing protein [Methylophilus sp.]